MNISLSPGGNFIHGAPQQRWRGEGDLQFALFAGQEMMAIRESDDSPYFELHYLGLMSTGFASMDEAKQAAATFVKAVLDELKSRVQE